MATPQESADALVQYWAPQFAAQIVDEELMHRMLRFIPAHRESRPDMDVEVLYGEPKNSASGLDGITFRCWAGVADLSGLAIRGSSRGQVSRSSTESVAPPPKAEAPRLGEVDIVAVRAAGNARPLQLGTCDAKLVARLANTVLSKLADVVCLPHQRGFIQGHQMTDSIVEIYTIACSCGAQRCRDTAARREKAFVKIAHLFLFGALRRIGCPRRVAIVRPARRDVERFRITLGTRQGCPASGTLWAIAFECVLRAMAPRTGVCPRGVC